MRKEPLSPARSLLLILVLAVSTLAAAGLGTRPPSAQAAGAALNYPTAECGSTATMTFSWTPVQGASQVWLDISAQDNGFAAGTFISAGPFAGNAASYAWPGMTVGLPIVWRINSFAGGAWQSSDTGAFVPCGNPSVLSAVPTCTSTTAANVTFRWAPMTPTAKQQWLDVGTDSNFGAGTFSSIGPLGANAQSYTMSNARAGGYMYYRVNDLYADGSSWYPSVASYFYAPCGGDVDTRLKGSGDSLVIRSLGINAPINVRNVGTDGQMGDPADWRDVVRYDFPAAPGLGGYPGKGGTTVLAGHVDYHDCGSGTACAAVFWSVRGMGKGDQIDYYRADGTAVSYAVDWTANLSGESEISQYLLSTNPETMVLITCDGTFNPATHQYDNRTMVHATKL